MSPHKFSTGQVVEARTGLWAPPAGAYEIIRRLPPSDSENRYRVKSVNDGHERVVKESDLANDVVWEGAPTSPISALRDSRIHNRSFCLGGW